MESLYTKYRPQTFEQVVGQKHVVETLMRAVSEHKTSHAYLFCGPRGTGKTTMARLLAKALMCEKGEGLPDGTCEQCRLIAAGEHPDVAELDAASRTGVDNVRDEIISRVNYAPTMGRCKVYIIDEVHMLTQSAFNAFLKTLEEPPAHAIFILATTEKHKILPTILSRCQTYDFNRISIPDIVRNLRDIATKENINIDDESLHIIARKADGAMRDALTIFDQTVAFCGTDVKYEDVIRNLNVLDYEHCFHLTDAMLANDYGSALLEFDNVLSKGFNALYFVASLSSHFRNLMVAKNGALDALLEFPDSLKLKYKEQADRCPIQFLYDALSVTSQCESGYKESINPRLHIEFALMKLCFLTGGPVSLRPAAPVTAPQAAPQSAPRTAPQPVPRPQPQPEPAQPDTAPVKPVNVAETPVAQPVAETAAAPETPASPETPAETAAPARRKRTSKSAALSLDAIKEESNATSSEVANNNLSDRIPENAEITGHWQKLPEQYRSRPRLYSTLATTKLNVKEMDGYKLLEFYVMNLAQKTWVEQELLRELEDKLQKSLGTKRVRLAVEVIPEEVVEKKIYMPEDKAKAMMAGNEEIRNLVKDLDLDVK